MGSSVECATSINETPRYAISIIWVFVHITQHWWTTSNAFLCVSLCFYLLAYTGAALRHYCTFYQRRSIVTISKITSSIVSLLISGIIVASQYFSFDFYRSKVFYECVQTSNARRYDSRVDPRLSFYGIAFQYEICPAKSLNENKWKYYSAFVRTSLPIPITMHFNRSQLHFHCRRELIERFLVFDRQPSRQTSNALLDSFTWNCSTKDLHFEGEGVNSDDVPPKLTPLLRSHFNTMFYQTRSRIPIRIYSASSFTSRFSFESAHLNHTESRSLA